MSAGDTDGRKTERAYWDQVHGSAIRMRLPSPLRVGTRNLQRLFRRYVRPGDRVLEIGFAPGKHLAWLAARLGAEVSGIDYSEGGVAQAQRLFEALGLRGDLRCEDLFANDFAPESFDLVYSIGVIEHFDDPRPAVRQHLRLVRPGGVALLLVPNFRGIYGRMEALFDPAHLAIHNLDIMSVPALKALIDPDARASVTAFPFGHFVSSLVSWEKRLPRAAVSSIHVALNGVGLLQPVDIAPVCPWLVLEARRQPA
jgi:2-polyprenyl-3-methyl-5-hydroxy-6-metoxy-1,4-benzoquinol methylase